MNRKNLFKPAAALSLALGAGLLVAAGLAIGSGGKNKHRLAGAKNPLYLEECGSCHLAYPPGLLPGAAWQRVMAGLDDHYGDNAELDASSGAAILDYLQSRAADSRGEWQSSKYAREQPPSGAAPRISERRWFRRKHDEIPQRLVGDNPEVGGFSNCDSCHRKADKGDFDDDNVRIPGYGRWDD